LSMIRLTGPLSAMALIVQIPRVILAP